jgi:hypothetical protein
MRFAADENFNNDTLRALLQKLPDLDGVRVQDSEMYQHSDPALLDWTAREGRILLTHDFKTMPKHAYARVAAGLRMPGVIQVDTDAPIAIVVEHLQILIEAGTPDDFESQVRYVPLR